LQLCAERDYTNIVELLLENGADIHVNNGEPLKLSSMHGHDDTVKLLLKNGADIHARQDTAIRSAIAHCRNSTIKLLIENGADIHAKNDSGLRRLVQIKEHLCDIVETVKLLFTYYKNFTDFGAIELVPDNSKNNELIELFKTYCIDYIISS
jgi:ankyrin repeat protein